MRRLLLEEIGALVEGREPYAPHHGDLYWVRSASMLLQRDVPFEEGARASLAAEV
jgi:hypothetical protein